MKPTEEMKKLSIAFVAALLCGAGAMAATAGARANTPTTVTIEFNGDGFHGQVKSPRPHCVKSRTVKVYKQKGSFPDPRGRDKKLFKDKSNREGRWDTGNTGQAQGKLYALAERTVSHGQIACKKGVSKTIKV